MSRKANVSSISIVISITMVLFVLGLFGLLIINANKFTNHLEENVLVILYLDQDIAEDSAVLVEKEVKAMAGVKSVNYVSKEEAAFAYKEVLEKDFVEILGDNPLPASLEVFLEAEMSSSRREKLLEAFKLVAGVAEIDHQQDLVAQIEHNKQIIGRILIILALLLAVISLVLVNNTIRLSVYAKRFTIRSMQLVGATEWFIIRPFILRSFVHVLISAVLAMGLTIGAYFLLGKWIQSNLMIADFELIGAQVFLKDIQIYSLLFALLIGLGMAIVLPGTYFATQKYLRMRVEDLY